jgi:hypothetical protein
MFEVFYSTIAIALLIFIAVFFFCFFIFKHKKMKKYMLLAWTTIFIISSAVFGLNGYGIKYYNIQTAASKTYSQKELLADFNVLKETICKHNPLAFADRAEVTAMFETAEKYVVDGMTEEEFYKLVNPLVVATKCGHTNLSVSKALIEYRRNRAMFFPVSVRIQDGKIVAGDSNQKFGIQAGDILLNINGNSSGEIITCMNKNISHDGDNVAAAQYIAGNHFGYEYYEFVEKPEKFEISLLNADGEQYTVTVDGEYQDKQNTAAWQLHIEEYAGVEYYNYDIVGKNATLTVRAFFEGNEKFNSFLDRFFEKAKNEDIEKLTIDVRGNFGGSPQMSIELLSYLVDKETPYFTEDTKLPMLYKIRGLNKKILPKKNSFVGSKTLIIDSGCFSTCGHFAAVFKANDLGYVLGEPTGGGAVCTDGATDIVLRNTGIRLHCSQKMYGVVANESMRNTVKPD